MAELDDNDPRVQAAVRRLQARLRFVGLGALDWSVLDRLEEIVRDAAAEFKREFGYDFPPLGPFVLPSAKIVVWFRRDLDDDDVQKRLHHLLIDLTRRGIQADAREFAQAAIRLWPNYRPAVEHYRADERIGRRGLVN